MLGRKNLDLDASLCTHAETSLSSGASHRRPWIKPSNQKQIAFTEKFSGIYRPSPSLLPRRLQLRPLPQFNPSTMASTSIPNFTINFMDIQIPTCKFDFSPAIGTPHVTPLLLFRFPIGHRKFTVYLKAVRSWNCQSFD